MPDELNPQNPPYNNLLDDLAAAEERSIMANLPPESVPRQHSNELGTDTVPPPVVSTDQVLPTPVAEPPPAVPPVPAETPSPEQPPPPPTEPPKVESKPEGKPDALQREKRLAEQRARETERELQAERERLAALQRERDELARQLHQQTQPEGAEQIEPDPLTQMQNEIAQMRQQLYARQVDDQLTQQARTFSQQHADYEQALQYYVESETKAAQLTGELDVVADRVRQVNPDGVRNIALQQGITEADASRNLAMGVLVEARKQALIAGAQRQGRTVPEVIYELANTRGFKGANGTPAAAPTAQAPAPGTSAAEQVRAEQTRAASESLASMPTGATTPPRRVNSINDFHSMTPNEQDKYIAEMDAKAARGEVPRDWDQQLQR